MGRLLALGGGHGHGEKTLLESTTQKVLAFGKSPGDTRLNPCASAVTCTMESGVAVFCAWSKLNETAHILKMSETTRAFLIGFITNLSFCQNILSITTRPLFWQGIYF